MTTLSVTMSMGAADGLQKAIETYRPLESERDRLKASKAWIRKSMKGVKGDVTLIAKHKSLLWLAECVVKPGKGYAAAASIMAALSSQGEYEPPPVNVEQEAREVRQAIERGDYEWAMTGWEGDGSSKETV